MKLEDLHDVETRVTNEATGGQKGKKLTQLGALDPVALIQLARVAGMGAEKYAAFNYLKGYDWSLSFDQLMRHALLFWAGEDVDQESGQPHMAHAAWAALALVSFAARGIGNDNRPPRLLTTDQTLAELVAKAFSVEDIIEAAIVKETWGTGDGEVVEPKGCECPGVLAGFSFAHLEHCSRREARPFA